MKLIIVVALLAVTAVGAELGPVKIQRRNDVEFTHGVLNDPGELTYSIADGGTAVLTLGAAEGNVVVSDPFAIRLAPQRVLSPNEWAVTLGDGVTMSDAGAYVFFDAYKTEDTVRLMSVTPVNALTKIARVTYDINSYMVNVVRSTTEDKITWTGTSTYDIFMDPLDKGGRMFVSNIVVYAWEGDERTATVDFTLSDLSVTDKTGTYNMSGLRQWIMSRYDSKTGDQWSKFPATHSVRLADKPLWFDSVGVVRLSSWSGGDTNTVAFTVGGTPVFEITPGAAEMTDQLKIVDYVLRGDTQAVFYVSAYLNVPIGLQTTASLDPANWADVSTGLTSTYPTISSHTVGDTTYNVFVLTLALNPASPGGFYRAKASVGSVGATTLEIKNCTLVYKGHPLGIVTQVVGGVTYEVLGNIVP